MPLHAPTLWLGLAAVAALALALRLPVATTVLGLAVFGVLHNVLELRYVAGRFDAVLAGPFLTMLATLVTGVLVCRLLPPTAATRAAEILLSYVLLSVACLWTLRRRPWWLAGSLGVLGAAAATSLTFPAYHFVVLTHLHNVVPLFFLWEWSRAWGAGARWPFRAVNLGWVVVVPGLILAGVFDPLLRAAPAALAGFGGVAAFEPARMVASYAPPALAGTDMGVRFLAVFAFMQTMHYVVWVGVLPRYAPEAAQRFDRRVPVLRGGRAWLLGGGARGRARRTVRPRLRPGPDALRGRGLVPRVPRVPGPARPARSRSRRPPMNYADAAPPPEYLLGGAGCAAVSLPVRRLRDRARSGAVATQPPGQAARVLSRHRLSGCVSLVSPTPEGMSFGLVEGEGRVGRRRRGPDRRRDRGPPVRPDPDHRPALGTGRRPAALADPAEQGGVCRAATTPSTRPSTATRCRRSRCCSSSRPRP